MTDSDIKALMMDCGLMPINKLEYINKKFLHTDSFIEGDEISLMQFASELLKHQKEIHACLVEQMGIDGYGTLAIAAAIRAEEG